MSKIKGIDLREIKCCDTAGNTIEAGISFEYDNGVNMLCFHFLEDYKNTGQTIQRTKIMYLNEQNTEQLVKALLQLDFD